MYVRYSVGRAPVCEYGKALVSFSLSNSSLNTSVCLDFTAADDADAATISAAIDAALVAYLVAAGHSVTAADLRKVG